MSRWSPLAASSGTRVSGWLFITALARSSLEPKWK